MICPIHNQEYAQCGHLPHKIEEIPVMEEKWFKELPNSERLVWLKIIRNQIVENLQLASRLIFSDKNDENN